jgi:hypothetical protein
MLSDKVRFRLRREPGKSPDDCEFLVAGHSHIFALGAAYGYNGPLGLVRHPHGLCDFVMENWAEGRGDKYWDELVRRARDRTILLVYKGNQHHAFLLASDPPFDLFDERTPEMTEGATVVPRRLVRAYFGDSVVQIPPLVHRLQAARCRKVRVLGTPPPKADIGRFADLIRRAPAMLKMTKRLNIDIARVDITPAATLLKLWRILQDVTREVAESAGAEFIPVPPQAFDSEGYLAKPFYDYTPTSVTHANRKYGNLLLRAAMQ